MIKLISDGMAIILAHFAHPTAESVAATRAMDGRAYAASLSAAKRRGLLASVDTFPFSAITDDGRAALLHYATNRRASK